MFWFGAHVARAEQWIPVDGFGGAADISGSPYHVSMALFDGSRPASRELDNQMAANRLGGTVIVVKDVTTPATHPQDFGFIASWLDRERRRSRRLLPRR